MAQLQWHDKPEQSAPHQHPSPTSSASNPWFGIAMGLMGLIIGYGIGAWW